MKFLLLMHMKTDAASTANGIMNWKPEEIKAHIGHMIEMNRKLKESGEFVAAEGLAWPDQAKLVRAAADGSPVTDGVFPETKEFLIGYWMLDVETPERAYEIAAQASMAPGRGGKPLHMPIEVRQIMAGPPEEFL